MNHERIRRQMETRECVTLCLFLPGPSAGGQWAPGAEEDGAGAEAVVPGDSHKDMYSAVEGSPQDGNMIHVRKGAVVAHEEPCPIRYGGIVQVVNALITTNPIAWTLASWEPEFTARQTCI